jgi:hypothetical protein
MPATGTIDSHHCSCLGHLGQCHKDRIVSISCCVAQGGQGKYCFVSLLPTISLINFANVNDPLLTLATLRNDGQGKKALFQSA